jgi:hypothetical protein
MSKSPLRRKKARPAKLAAKTFMITIEAQPMRVSYQPLRSGFAHFEFRSPYRPARRIPVSDTGYRSYFAPLEDVKDARGPESFARNFVWTFLRSQRKRLDDPRQLRLFQ